MEQEIEVYARIVSKNKAVNVVAEGIVPQGHMEDTFKKTIETYLKTSEVSAFLDKFVIELKGQIDAETQKEQAKRKIFKTVNLPHDVVMGISEKVFRSVLLNHLSVIEKVSVDAFRSTIKTCSNAAILRAKNR